MVLLAGGHVLHLPQPAHERNGGVPGAGLVQEKGPRASGSLLKLTSEAIIIVDGFSSEHPG